MSKTKRTLFAVGCLAVFFGVSPIAIFFYNAVRWENRVDERLATFADYSYDDWRAISEGCAEISQTGGELAFGSESEGWDRVPGALRQTEAKWIRVAENHVTMRFSGGHSRFVHIEYRGNRHPPELELIAEGLYQGIVFPSEDRSTVREKLTLGLPLRWRG